MTKQKRLDVMRRAYMAFEESPGPDQRKALIQAMQGWQGDLPMSHLFTEMAEEILDQIDAGVRRP